MFNTIVAWAGIAPMKEHKNLPIKDEDNNLLKKQVGSYQEVDYPIILKINPAKETVKPSYLFYGEVGELIAQFQGLSVLYNHPNKKDFFWYAVVYNYSTQKTYSVVSYTFSILIDGLSQIKTRLENENN